MQQKTVMYWDEIMDTLIEYNVVASSVELNISTIAASKLLHISPATTKKDPRIDNPAT